MYTRRLPLFALTFAVLGLTACGGGEEPVETPAPTPEPQAAEPTPPAPADEPVPAYDGPAFELTMTPVGEQMVYEQTEFTVHPGQTVHLTFQNTATNPAMSHNVVVLRDEASINPVGQAAMAAAANDYIPEGQMDRIIAHTPSRSPARRSR
jgi:azurin